MTKHPKLIYKCSAGPFFLTLQVAEVIPFLPIYHFTLPHNVSVKLEHYIIPQQIIGILYHYILNRISYSRGRDSSVGIASRYGLDGPGIESRWGAILSSAVQTDPRAHPTSYTTVTESFARLKRPGRDADHPPASSAEVEVRIELSWPVGGWTLALPLPLPYSHFSVHSSVSLLAHYFMRRNWKSGIHFKSLEFLGSNTLRFAKAVLFLLPMPTAAVNSSGSL